MVAAGARLPGGLYCLARVLPDRSRRSACRRDVGWCRALIPGVVRHQAGSGALRCEAPARTTGQHVRPLGVLKVVTNRVAYCLRRSRTKKSTPPASRAVPNTTGPAVVCGGGGMWGPPVVSIDPSNIKPLAISQRPRTTNPAATTVNVIRMVNTRLAKISIQHEL